MAGLLDYQGTLGNGPGGLLGDWLFGMRRPDLIYANLEQQKYAQQQAKDAAQKAAALKVLNGDQKFNQVNVSPMQITPTGAPNPAAANFSQNPMMSGTPGLIDSAPASQQPLLKGLASVDPMMALKAIATPPPTHVLAPNAELLGPNNEVLQKNTIPKQPIIKTVNQGDQEVTLESTDGGQTFHPFQMNGKPVVAPRYKPASSSVITNLDDPAVGAHVSAVLSGNETMRQVPVAYRTAVAEKMQQIPKAAYTPLASSRFTMAANRIAQNYIKLPQYQLTANGLPYLQRIDAALQVPGSVSDQDLLDSLTKLNTAGNAITDAQVKIITDGKSFKDWAGVIGNKMRNGGVLSDNQRQQIAQIAKNIYNNYKKGYGPVYKQVTSQLKAAGIPEPFWTVPDLNNLSGGLDTIDGVDSNTSNPAAPPAQPQSPQAAPPATAASETKVIDGVTYHKINGKWYSQ